MRVAQVIIKDGAFEIQIYKGDGDVDYFIENGEPDGEWETYKRWEQHHIRDGETDEHGIRWSYNGEDLDVPEYVHSSIVTAIFHLMRMGYAVVGAF